MEQLPLERLNAELKYLRMRLRNAGSSTVAKSFLKEIASVESVRLRRFGVAPRQT
jgi:hypothetical protein